MEAAEAPQDPAPTRTGTRRRGGTHSGRLLLRMPESLHADLARAADHAGVSLNAYINERLTQTVDGPTEPSSAQPQAGGGRKLVERLLVVNVVVLAAVGVLAVVLLVEALH